MKKYVETPLMKQYYSIKAVHPDAILLFRVGDFYETFGDDAIKASSILGITLTKRANGSASFVELAGFPYHALDTYMPKLVMAGQRVAICEQLEDPKKTKTIEPKPFIPLDGHMTVEQFFRDEIPYDEFCYYLDGLLADAQAHIVLLDKKSQWEAQHRINVITVFEQMLKANAGNIKYVPKVACF